MIKKWFKVYRNGLRTKASWCFYCIIWFCLGVSLHAQENYFRAIGGVPHLPVVADDIEMNALGSQSGMMVYNSEQVRPMLYTGTSWKSLCDASIFSSNGNAGYFQVVDGISVFPVIDSPTVPNLNDGNGGMAITFQGSSVAENSLRVYVASDGWQDIESLDGIGLNPTLYINKEFTCPVRQSDPSPEGLSAGAFYINATDAVFKWYDGSAWHELNCGCFAYTNPEKTTILEFMCHNLGADTSLDPFTWKNTHFQNDLDIKGSLYQWGRTADGHQSRQSAALDQYVSGSQSHFVISSNLSKVDWRSTPNSNLWAHIKGVNDPCPVGYRVPTIEEWRSIFRPGVANASPSTATNNTWTWTGKGYTIGRSANNYNLYLPAAGQRAPTNGAIASVGTGGTYWSSTSHDFQTTSYFMYFNGASFIRNDLVNSRIYGRSVRCVVE